MDYVHHNLHTGRVSVRRQPAAGATRRVDETADYVVVRNVVPHVSLKGLARLRDQGVRAVVADLRGTVTETGDHTRLSDCGLPLSFAGMRLRAVRRVTFNPFRADTFCYSDGGEFIGCDLLVVTGGYAYEVQA